MRGYSPPKQTYKQMKNTANPFKKNTPYIYLPKHFSFKCILSALLLLSFHHTSFTQSWTQGITQSMTPISNTFCNPPGPNCFELKIDNIPINFNPANVEQGHLSFWNLGDGTFRMKEIAPGIIMDTICHRFRANPYTTPSNSPIVQLTKRYDDDDKPEKLIIPPPNTGIQTGIPYPLPNLDNGNIGGIKITPSLLPRSQDKAVYAISYQIPDICDTANTNFQIKFNYFYSRIPGGNNEISVSPLEAKIFNEDGTIYSTTVSPNNLIGEVIIPIPSSMGYNTANIFLELQFNEMPEGEIVNLEAALIDANNFCDPRSTNIELTSVKSHDPNRVISNKPDICPGDTTSIEYSVIFQNIGMGPAETVIVRTNLPDYFYYDAAKINTLEPSGLSFTMPLNTSTRQLEWVLTDNNGLLKKEYPQKILRGTGEYGYEIGSPMEHFTIDTIKFSVKLNPTVPLPPCGVIPLKASIFFDNNTPIVTNDFLTKINCTPLPSCTPCTEITSTYTGPPIYSNQTQPVIIAKNKNNGQQNDIRPLVKLINDDNSNIKATFNKNGKYYFTATNGCTREIITVPVYPAIEPAIEESCNWWTCRLTINEADTVQNNRYLWRYKKDNNWKSATGNSLNFTNKDSVYLTVTTNDGNTFTYAPCVFCWKSLCLKYWWIILLMVICICFYKFSKRNHA